MPRPTKKDPVEAVKYAVRHCPPPVAYQHHRLAPKRWRIGPEQDGNTFDSRPKAWHAHCKAIVLLAIQICESGLDGVLTYGKEHMPSRAYAIAEAMEKSAMKTGKPRGGWKWSAESRKRLSESRKGRPRKQPLRRGYPPAGFTEAGAFEIPATGHRFTVTRTDLERLLALILP